MSDPFRGWGGGFGQLRADLMREQAIQRDSEAWWLREFAFARWAADTLWPAAIERWVQSIGEEAKWKA